MNPKNHLVLSLIVVLLCLLVQPSVQDPAAFPPSVVQHLASREWRYHHYLFHNIRNMWNSLNSTTQALIESYGWKPPRPAKDATGKAILNSSAGEDFLYMHRSMIANMNKLMRAAGRANTAGFVTIPDTDDEYYPMPPVYDTPSPVLTNLVKLYKNETWLAYLKREEKKLTNPDFLRNMTLAELGVYIEWTSDVHQGMHFRYSAYEQIMRVKNSDPIPVINSTYDDVNYHWLVDIFGSHVNPWFWKLHGWIDDRITDWQKAHNLPTIKWNNTWTGGNMFTLPKNLNITDDTSVNFRRLQEEGTDPMDMHDMDMPMSSLEHMEAVARIIAHHKPSDFFNELSEGCEKNRIDFHKNW